jgi:isopentenyl phosphate kinase
MRNLVLVKLGGSVITDKSKPFTARVEVINRLAKKIIKYKNKNTDLIIGHGQGSFAHIPAARYQTQNGIINSKSIFGFAGVSEMAKRPNTILTQEFLKLKIPAVSFSPMSFLYTKETKLASFFIKHIQRALEIGLIPVIYGDVILDAGKRGFCIYSGEKTLDILANKLAKFYKKITINYYTDTSGVYDDNGKTVSLITPKNFSEIKKFLKGSRNTDVTGGMIHKVEESLAFVKKLNAEVYIMNGLKEGKVTKISRS